MSQKQTPREEAAERIAEAAPGIGIAAHAVALDDFIRQQGAYRQRLADSHASQLRALGRDPTSGGSDMGDTRIFICGDINKEATGVLQAMQGGQAAQPAVTAEPSAPAADTSAPGNSISSSWPGKAALLAAALLGGGALGAGIPWLAGWYSPVSTTINKPLIDQELGVDVIPGGALK